MKRREEESPDKNVRQKDVEIWKISCRLASCLKQIADEIDDPTFTEVLSRMREWAVTLPDQITTFVLLEDETRYNLTRQDLRERVAENLYLVNYLSTEGYIKRPLYDSTIGFLSIIQGYLHTATFHP
ncbi:MAG: hypothetical protein LAT55_01015 [Opitutales bacterium]|nr:hypothetical protein [Opitutales bacterium]